MRYWNIYSLVYVISGQARFQDVTGRHAEVRTGDLMLMFPRHGYAYQVDPRSSWSELFIQFRGPTFDLWRENKVMYPGRPVIHLPPSGEWLRRFESVIEPSRLPEPYQTLKRLLALQEVLIDALLSSESGPQSRRHEHWLQRAIAKVDACPLDEAVDWDRIAEEMGGSQDRFRKRFKSLAGVSPARYRASRVMDHACHALHDTMKPLKEIARDCGFSDVFHFSKRFSQVVGIAPSRYRKHLAESPPGASHQSA